MITFNGDSAQKRIYLQRALALQPRIADAEAKHTRASFYWTQRESCGYQYVCQKGSGCDHSFYALEIGVPVGIAYAERALFLELPVESAVKWPERFVRALPLGVDLSGSPIIKELSLFVLADKQHGLLNFAQDAEQHATLWRIIELFRSDCQDAAQWKDAADQANTAYGKSRYDGRRMEPHEALAHAGQMACYSARYFAQCFEDPRAIEPALSWSGWPARYRCSAEFMSKQSDPRKQTRVFKKHGMDMVNVGESLSNMAGWVRLSDEGDRRGEALRAEHSIRLANFFLRLVKASAQGHPVIRLLGDLLRRAA